MSIQSLRTLKNYAAAGAVALGAIVGAQSPAFAGSHVFAFFNTTMTINGTTETDATNNVDPFDIQLFTAGNECLQVAVISQQADLEATLVSTDGRVWRDDDSNGSLRPRINAITNTRGWYILRVSHFTGASVHADFTMQVSRFASTDARCTPITAPSVTFSAQAKSSAAPAAPAALPGGTSKPE